MTTVREGDPLYHLSAHIGLDNRDINIDLPLMMIESGAADGGVIGSYNPQGGRWTYGFSLVPGLDLFTFVLRLADAWHDTAGDTDLWLSITFQGMRLADHLNVANLVYAAGAWACVEAGPPESQQPENIEVDMTVVQSSNIHAVGYVPGKRDLLVEFRSGDLYVYSDVPESVYVAFLAASSKGSYLHQHIKGSFTHKKVGSSKQDG